MANILKLLPLKTLIKLVFDLLKYIVSKTKNTKDDLIVQYLWDMWIMIEPVLPILSLSAYSKTKNNKTT